LVGKYSALIAQWKVDDVRIHDYALSEEDIHAVAGGYWCILWGTGVCFLKKAEKKLEKLDFVTTIPVHEICTN
jgi:hypothetical protein